MLNFLNIVQTLSLLTPVALWLSNTPITINPSALFICYTASANGFGHCRPVLGFDGAHLKGKYLGILLSATATDANRFLFPLAHAIVTVENDDN